MNFRSRCVQTRLQTAEIDQGVSRTRDFLNQIFAYNRTGNSEQGTGIFCFLWCFLVVEFLEIACTPLDVVLINVLSNLPFSNIHRHNREKDTAIFTIF